MHSELVRTIPGEVRERVLTDHAVLREMIRELRELARGGRDVVALHAPWADLLHALRAHLDLEDEMLIPTLFAVDPVLAALFAGEHESQRAWIVRTLAMIRDPKTSSARLVRDLLEFTEDLERDMTVEEAAVLNAEELPDDAFGIELPLDS